MTNLSSSVMADIALWSPSPTDVARVLRLVSSILVGKTDDGHDYYIYLQQLLYSQEEGLAERAAL